MLLRKLRCLFLLGLFPLLAQSPYDAGFSAEEDASGLRLRQADSLGAWAYYYWDRQSEVFDSSRQALELLDIVVRHAWRKPRHAEEAEALVWVQVNRGYHLFHLGRVLDAVAAYEAALTLYRSFPMPDFDAINYLYLPLGAHYTRLGDNEKAAVLYQTAISAHPTGPQDAMLAGIYNNLGLSYWNKGDPQKAIQTFRQGLDCKDLPAVKSGLLHLSLAKSYLDIGRADNAREEVRKARTSFLQAIKDPGEDPEIVSDYVSGACLLQGKLEQLQGRREAAQVGFQEALRWGRSSAPRDIAKIKVAQAELFRSMGRNAAGLSAANEALQILIPNFDARFALALPDAAQLYAENTIFEALEEKADALDAMAGRASDTTLLFAALRCHQLAGQAEALLRGHFDYESSKISLLAQSRRRTAKAIALARRCYEIRRDPRFLYSAWAFAEQVKAVLLLEAVRQHGFRRSLSGADTLLQEDRRLRQRLSYFERRLLLESGSPNRLEWLRQRDEILQHIRIVQQSLDDRFPAAATLSNANTHTNAETVKAFCDQLDGETVVEYFVADDCIHAFIKPSGGGAAQWIQIDGKDSLAAAVQRFSGLLQSRTALDTSKDSFLNLGYALYSALLKPLEETGISERLLLIPDAWLSFVPFEVLPDSLPAAGTGWQRVPFLVRRCTPYYAFSLAVLQTQRRLPALPEADILQVAPRFTGRPRGLVPLHNSLEEIPASLTCRSRVCTDSCARFDDLKEQMGRYRILHLSTHAGVDSLGEQPSVEWHDRAAYLPDIYALNLQADLVILSACQTGLGRLHQGEGVMSLSRAFAYAGARGLVATLWTVQENSTARILNNMYQGMLQEQSTAIALRQAKLAYLDDPGIPAFQKSPWYWAGLVYAGGNMPIRLERCTAAMIWPYLLAAAGLAAWIALWLRRRRTRHG